VRLTTDEGEEMIGANALMAAWPMLSGALDLEEGLRVLETNLKPLERADRVKLEAEPFTEQSQPYPGRVADYPPGVRENAGQYSHGVSWIVDAYLRCAELAHLQGKADLVKRCRDRAAEIWLKISPLSKADPIYGLPPHQQPADVYDGAGYEGRGGWSWYTGAAARMLSAAYALLGLRMKRGFLELDQHAFTPKGGIHLRRVVWRGKLYDR
jgi:cyclic beta-1,2-glucan synthetase